MHQDTVSRWGRIVFINLVVTIAPFRLAAETQVGGTIIGETE